MSLTLTRPIVFFDLETTGFSFENDRIVQIALLKIYPDGKEEMLNILINPGMPIPPSSTEIHGVTDDDVKDKPRFKKVAEQILDFIFSCDIGGFNINKFDLPFLRFEFQRAGIIYDVSNVNIVDPQIIYHKKEPRNLTAAYKDYCGKELDGAHNAEVDIRATSEVFFAQVKKYDDIGNTISEISSFSQYGDTRPADISGKLLYDKEGDLIFNFGKNKGIKVIDDLDYARWMVNKDFPEDTIELLRQIV